MKKDDCPNTDFNMRLRFCEQTIRFWKKSKPKYGCESPCEEEVCENNETQDNPYKTP